MPLATLSYSYSSQTHHVNLNKQTHQLHIIGLKSQLVGSEPVGYLQAWQGVELGSIEKQLQLSGQSGT